MPLQFNTKSKVPSEKETKNRILTTAQLVGCYNEAKQIIDKYEIKASSYMDMKSREQLIKELIIDLGKLDVNLIAWLVNEDGDILINGKVVFRKV